MMKIISSTANGQIFSCTRHNTVHFEFGNIFLNMSFEELDRFKEVVSTTDYEAYLHKNKDAQNNRKLLLPLGFENGFFALNKQEFLELKELLSEKKEDTKLIITKEIIDTIILN